VTWLTRQLGPDTPAGLVVEAWPSHARQPLTATLDRCREDPNVLVDPDRRDTLRFRLVLRAEMGQNRKDGGRSPGFVESVMRLVRTFYGSVLQQVTPWVPQAPQTRSGGTPAELKQEPIEDREDLTEAISAARDEVAEKTGDPLASDGLDEPTESAVPNSEFSQAFSPGLVAMDDEDLIAAPTGAVGSEALSTSGEAPALEADPASDQPSPASP
jgi:hypothetical protein